MSRPSLPTLSPEVAAAHREASLVGGLPDANLLLCLISIAIFLLIFTVYAKCVICSMRGQLDLIVDEETRQPTSTMFFKNPFRKRSAKKDSYAMVQVNNESGGGVNPA